MTLPRITSHAISRYRSRVAPVSYDEAKRRMSNPAITRLVEFAGSRCEIKLPTGHKLVVVDGIVVTVRPKPLTKPIAKETGE